MAETKKKATKKKTAKKTAAKKTAAKKTAATKTAAKKTAAKKKTTKKKTAAKKTEAAADKRLSVRLTKSLNRRRESHKACVRGLGLRRIGHTVQVADTPENRGMIKKVSYLLSVEEA